MNIAGHIIVAGLTLATVGGAVASKGRAAAAPLNVSVVNTPNVNVVNSPTVNVGNVPDVTPRDKREAVYFKIEASGSAIVNESADGIYVVPDGKRLVITQVSGLTLTPGAVRITWIRVIAGSSISSPSALEHVIVPVFTASNVDDNAFENFSERTEFIAKPGDHIGAAWGQSAAPGDIPDSRLTMYISGYLEPTP